MIVDICKSNRLVILSPDIKSLNKMPGGSSRPDQGQSCQPTSPFSPTNAVMIRSTESASFRLPCPGARRYPDLTAAEWLPGS